MEKIASKTKIKELDLKCKKMDISFKLLDLTSRQVGNMNRLIRDSDNDYVGLTISADDKELEIPDIQSNVKLAKMELIGKGQHLKITGFKVSGDKLETLNNYIDSEAWVIITIEQTQSVMINESGDDATHHEEHEESEDGFDDNPSTTSAGSDEKRIPDIVLKLPPKWGVKCSIKIAFVEGYWRYGYVLKIGNAEDINEFDKSDLYEDLIACCDGLISDFDIFISAQTGFKQKAALKKKILNAVEEFQTKNC